MVDTLEFEKGTGHKKYKVTIYRNKKKYKTVQFGSVSHKHYKDTTPLKLYSDMDHYDLERKARYRKRASKIKNKNGKYTYTIKYTPNWFSYNFLWS